MLIKKNEAVVSPFIASEGTQYNSHYPIYYRKLLHCEAKKPKFGFWGAQSALELLGGSFLPPHCTALRCSHSSTSQ